MGIEWAFMAADDARNSVSNLLNLYGYLTFGGPLWAALIGSVFPIATKMTGSKLKGDFFGVVTLMCFSWLLVVVVSIQMCFQADSTASSPAAMVFFVPLLRSAFYSFPFTCLAL